MEIFSKVETSSCFFWQELTKRRMIKIAKNSYKTIYTHNLKYQRIDLEIGKTTI
jgi:hypothetical protein